MPEYVFWKKGKEKLWKRGHVVAFIVEALD
jgi:hypothetical protein